MFTPPRNRFRAAPAYQPILREVGLDAEAVFTHPDIVVWRSITERENCTLDATLVDGRAIRLHIKRYHPHRGWRSAADEEAQGIRALEIEKIPTAPLVGWGQTADGRSFIITEDLAGYRPADKLLAAPSLSPVLRGEGRGEGSNVNDGHSHLSSSDPSPQPAPLSSRESDPDEPRLRFEQILIPTADLAARLHSASLHHRDLYLCHFFVREDEPERDIRLIDAARVRRLPGWPMRQRWTVKDLAQFWYSTLSLPITDQQRAAWLDRYGEQRKLSSTADLCRAVERKADSIARHDAKLRERQPTRNISIPEGNGSDTRNDKRPT